MGLFILLLILRLVKSFFCANFLTCCFVNDTDFIQRKELKHSVHSSDHEGHGSNEEKSTAENTNFTQLKRIGSLIIRIDYCVETTISK